MNKILIIIIVLIVAFGAFTILGNNKSTPEPASTQNNTTVQTQPQEEIVTVNLEDEGFTPKEITVKTGTRVIWINKSAKAGTVSSDDHPTHRLYPFLNLGEFAPDSSVQVVFDNAGTYTYHNHYNATSTGTVTVE